MEFSSARWQTILKFNNIVYGRSLSYVWACKVLLSSLLELQGWKSKTYFQNFIQIVQSLEFNNCYDIPQMTRNQRKLIDKCFESVWWEWNGFAGVVVFYHVTCRYFDKFQLQGVDRNWCQACIFYLAPGLICEEYW